jgi:hypothetical protein
LLAIAPQHSWTEVIGKYQDHIGLLRRLDGRLANESKEKEEGKKCFHHRSFFVVNLRSQTLRVMGSPSLAKRIASCSTQRGSETRSPGTTVAEVQTAHARIPTSHQRSSVFQCCPGGRSFLPSLREDRAKRGEDKVKLHNLLMENICEEHENSRPTPASLDRFRASAFFSRIRERFLGRSRRSQNQWPSRLLIH